jgi:hypothetical protein
MAGPRLVERNVIMSPCQGFMLTAASARSRENSPTLGHLHEIMKDRGVVSGEGPSPCDACCLESLLGISEIEESKSDFDLF